MKTLTLQLLGLMVSGSAFGAELLVPKDYKTIQAAIDAAGEGDSVKIAEGTYRERLQLRKGVVVRGLEEAKNTILDAGGESPGVVMAEGSKLIGLTVTNAGKFDQAVYDKHHKERGENLTNEQGAVGVEGSAPAIQVDVTATIMACIVHDNGHAGIGVSGEGNKSLIKGNLVYRNMGGGIGIANEAEPMVTDNECFENLRAGIGCRASNPKIVGNRCHHNVRAGIGIREGAKPLVANNLCYENRRAGIGNRMRGTAPTIRENKCFKNGMAGIGTRNEASPLIEGNECYENKLAGIGSMDNAKPTIVGNTIYGNEMAAIGFDACQSGVAVIRDNDIKAKTVVAIGLQGGWTATIEGNTIQREGGMPPLVMVFKDAKADFSKNTFIGSGVAGIRCQGEIKVNNNVFKCPEPRKGGPPQNAVWAPPGSKVEYGENTVEGWRQALAK
ncbi:MAG: right-handed parallel beta-helix repeat-containing protein [Verrucomicrobiota bacterium]